MTDKITTDTPEVKIEEDRVVVSLVGEFPTGNQWIIKATQCEIFPNDFFFGAADDPKLGVYNFVFPRQPGTYKLEFDFRKAEETVPVRSLTATIVIPEN